MKTLSIFIVLLLLPVMAAATTIAVCNFPSSASVQVRIYDITATTLTQDWTAGATERAVGLSKSCYYYSLAATAGHSYQIDWRDASSPTKVASEVIYEQQTYPDASTSSRLASVSYSTPPSAVSIRQEIDANSIKLDTPVSTRLASSSYNSPPSASTISTTLLDMSMTGHTTSGTAGGALNAASSAGDPWSSTLSGYAAGTAGYRLANNLDAAVSTRLASASYAAPPSASTIGTTLLDLTLAGHTTSGTAGGALNSAAAGADPWQASLADYGLGTAGYYLLNTLDVAVSSRLSGTVLPNLARVQDIRTDLDTNSEKLANLDTTVSSRLAATDFTGVTNVLDQPINDHLATGTVGAAIKTASLGPSSSDLLAIKTQTDRLTFNTSNQVSADATVDTAKVASDLLDSSISGHTNAGSVGERINSAAAAGDPMASPVPGTYGPGTAGYAIANMKTYSLPVMQGSVYTAVATQAKTVSVVRKDSPRVTFDLGADYSNWTPVFGAKVRESSSSYIIGTKEAVWTDATKGQGYFDLLSSETTVTAGTYYGELVLTRDIDDKRLTAIKFNLKILQNVVN